VTWPISCSNNKIEKKLRPFKQIRKKKSAAAAAAVAAVEAASFRFPASGIKKLPKLIYDFFIRYPHH